MFGRCEKMARMDSPEPSETATTDEQRPATCGPRRIRYGATLTRKLIRIAYRDPQHSPNACRCLQPSVWRSPRGNGRTPRDAPDRRPSRLSLPKR